MLFNSFIFFAFLAIVLALYRRLEHRGQNRMLLVASYVFYGYWDWRFLSLIFISTVVDYFAAIAIESSGDPKRRKLLLLCSLATNLGFLGVFKYYGFFAVEAVDLLNSIGFAATLPSLQIVLPVGISFYTFQTMSYTIDVHRGDNKATRDFLNFALFVCFFPQLVAGPVERSQRLMPQILKPRPRHPDHFREGLYHIVIGLFKKVIIADNMAQIANAVFATPTTQLTGPECLIGVYAFAFQIYGDFSGYSSIAQGIARWMGFDLMTNFRMPYFAITPSDFWRRWHISLSQWLRDYLYVSLGGNRGGRLATYRNLLLTMVLGGLWHGAGWTFLAWGAFHGLLLCGYRVFEQRAKSTATQPAGRMQHGIAWLLMFHFVCIGWLFFRADSIGQAGAMLIMMATNFSVTSLTLSAMAMIVFFAGPIMLFEFWLERRGHLLSLLKVHWLPRGMAYAYCALMLVFFLPSVKQEFIYFQF
jgi:alginate O-acetyltransferase complex protein AlgI